MGKPEQLIRKRIGTQAWLSFVEGAKYGAKESTTNKHILAAAEKHMKAVLEDFDSAPVGERETE